MTNTELPNWLESAQVEQTNHPVPAPTTTPTQSPSLYPTTNAERELLNMQRKALFVNVIERLEQGSLWKEIMEDSPYPEELKNTMMAWIKKDPQRWKEYKEAQAVGAEIIAATTISIADGDGLEDVARSNLRVQQRWRYCEMVDKKRFGKDQPAAPTFGSGGISININAVDNPYQKPPVEVIEATPIESTPAPIPTVEFGGDL